MASRIINVALIVSIVLVLGSCAAPTTITSYQTRIPASDWLVSGNMPLSGYGAYGYVILRKNPIEILSSREGEFCKHYREGMMQTGVFKYTNKENLMPTYWMLKADDVDKKSCESLIENYDFERATKIAATTGNLGSIGPLLIAWRLPFEIKGNQEALVIDLENIPPSEFSKVISIWTEEITNDPEAWANGFDIKLIRLKFGVFIDKYGDKLISLAKLAK